MARFYCEYCKSYLTHDKRSVMKAHIQGKHHIKLIKQYYLNKYIEQETSRNNKKQAAHVKDHKRETIKAHTKRNQAIGKKLLAKQQQSSKTIKELSPKYEFEKLNKEDTKLMKLNSTRAFKKRINRMKIRSLIRDFHPFDHSSVLKERRVHGQKLLSDVNGVENGYGVLNHLYKHSPGYNKVFISNNRFDNPNYSGLSTDQRKGTEKKNERNAIFHDDINVKNFLKKTNLDSKKYNYGLLKPPKVLTNRKLKLNVNSVTGPAKEFIYMQNENFYKLFMKSILSKKLYSKQFHALKNVNGKKRKPYRLTTAPVGLRAQNGESAGRVGNSRFNNSSTTNSVTAANARFNRGAASNGSGYSGRGDFSNTRGRGISRGRGRGMGSDRGRGRGRGTSRFNTSRGKSFTDSYAQRATSNSRFSNSYTGPSSASSSTYNSTSRFNQ